MCAIFLVSRVVEMSMMGELSFFLGLKIKQSSNRTYICQEKYIKELLKKLKIEDAKPIDTPIGINVKLNFDELGPSINQTMYRGIIGSLLYLITTCLDIVFSMGMCGRFPVNLKESHLKATKRILRYLKKTWDLVLYYPPRDTFELIGMLTILGTKLIEKLCIQWPISWAHAWFLGVLRTKFSYSFNCRG